MFWGGAGINCAFKTVQKLVRMGVDLYPFEVTQGKSVLVLMIWGGAGGCGVASKQRRNQ